MPRIIKNTLLEHISDDFFLEKVVNSTRIYELNNNVAKPENIFYICEREIRAKDNFALQFAIQKSKKLNLPLKIIYPKVNYKYKPKQEFIDKQVLQARKMFKKIGLDFEIIRKSTEEIVKNVKNTILIIDFNPILKRNYLKNSICKIYEIDGHNILPARFISDKQEYSAATIRTKIYHNINQFLTEFENLTKEKVEVDFVLEDFIKNKLPYYKEFRNHPDKNITSGLSKYLNLGFISSQRIALEVIKSDATSENKEAFLEELIVRKELADNFCLYSKSFKDFSNIPNWVKSSLESHKYDIRSYIYHAEDLEQTKTHDKLWNATQNQLIQEGVIHSYLRMYWAKKILEWTISKEEALKIAIYLNDKYAYDAPSANGYVGILWALGGLHDRAFVDYPVTGKIRRMTYNSMKRKYNLTEYIKKYTLE